MIVTINKAERRQGAKGEYLYIAYTTTNNKQGGKAVFKELAHKWELCKPGNKVELTLDERYNVTDMGIVSGGQGQEDLSAMKEAAEAGKKAEAQQKPRPELTDKDKLILQQVVWKGNIELIKIGKFKEFYGEDEALNMLHWQKDMAKRWAFGG